MRTRERTQVRSASVLDGNRGTAPGMNTRMRRRGDDGDRAEPSDVELWRGVVDGDPAAFEQLFDRHANAIYAFCVRRTGDRTVAEDLMSTTFLHAWRRRADMLPTDAGPVPWLYGIATNLVRRHLRGTGRARAARARIPADRPGSDPAEEIVDRIDGADRADRTMRALATLPAADRELFELCVWQGLSYEEAAVALRIPVGTVRSRLSRARGRLRLTLAEPTDVTGHASGDHAGARRRGGGADG